MATGYIFEVTPDSRRIDTMYDETLTRVTVTEGDFRATGNAKRLIEDDYDFDIGYTLAYSRAYQRLMHKIEKAVARHPEDFK